MPHTGKIDAVGKVSIDSKPYGEFRLIESGPNQIALFKDGTPISVEIMELDGTYTTKARKLSAKLSDGREMLFVRNGCGCQTPASLRGPRSRFLAQIPDEVDV